MIDPFILSIILIAGLSLCGLSIGVAMICGSTVYLAMKGFDPSIAAETLLQGLLNSYTLLAIPLFILAADIMNIGSLADRLLRFCQALVGRFHGGLGHVNVVSSLIFSGMSGSAVADAVGMGRIIINMMTKDGHYTKSYAAALTAATATIGPIIPPSIPMVLYALVSDQSVGYLFAAGMAPGLLMALLMALTNSVVARKRGFPIDDSVAIRDIPAITFQAIPALMLPVILLGGIYSGVVTPTEAAAVAAFYALVISVVFYRSVSVRQFYRTLASSSRSTAAVGILIAGALTFNYVITRENVPNSLADFLAQYELSKWGFLIAINILILVLGCILEGGAILLIIVPIFIPTAQALGIDLVHFGVVVVVNAMLGLVTPPYGLLLFIVANITGQPMGRIVRDLLPFLIALFASLVFITFVPDFVLFLPRLLGYQG
ncbi:MAG: TRAP transporter large permease [Hoeflea sp.]|uniref:TRAP transporter large permease n=1 Tax=Hoeflea sp. TaxID=1940281 RepID=UPI001DE0B60C|nr:TRAP transporter large permease [Hoeflea sp.]MBU4527785.1 TRAP transporter large permease [Alphaproteobacteria bacterium]MBU4546180.1 TRAP transporter large permease [Alphaproteobacteria bacterium]MBU4553135.1 TRAP transporter large permease [Alphaproteobacteria bacterium]MBV1724207.1 TRAP transporter large permease [Hoeflea sp.]MBV1759892.1 TRAP transporter large permease [Hoeflea sp.]